MATTTEIKPSTFRISEEVKNRFKEITKSEGWNQDEALNKLIAIYEIEQAKITIGSRKVEIETFETHLQALSEVYRMSLQLNMDAEERIKAAYAATLESNQKMIQDLQDKNDTLKQSLEDATLILDKNKQLEKEIERIRAEMQKTDSLCQEYRDKNDTLNGLLAEYKADRETNKSLLARIKELKQSQEDIHSFRKQAESDLKITTLELKEEHQKQVQEIKLRHLEELEQATADYRKVLQELEELRKENYGLKEQLLKKPAPAKRTTKKSSEKSNEKASD